MDLLRERASRHWSGAGWNISACPGTDIRLTAAQGQLTVDDQDVEEVAHALLSCADDGLTRIIESCADGPAHIWYVVAIGIDSDGKNLVIDAQYDPVELTVARSQAHPLAAALLDANDHAVAGPCPWCDVPMDDDHPSNGCPELT